MLGPDHLSQVAGEVRYTTVAGARFLISFTHTCHPYCIRNLFSFVLVVMVLDGVGWCGWLLRLTLAIGRCEASGLN